MKVKVLFVALLGITLLLSSVALAGGRPLSASLTGAAEVAGGDPDGSGTAHLTLNSGQEEICFDLSWNNIAPPTRAHIHRGVAGVNGPIVVTFFDLATTPPVPVTNSGCVDVPRDLVKEIRQNPEAFYVNIHNADFPAGAIRGQLSK